MAIEEQATPGEHPVDQQMDNSYYVAPKDLFKNLSLGVDGLLIDPTEDTKVEREIQSSALVEQAYATGVVFVESDVMRPANDEFIALSNGSQQKERMEDRIGDKLSDLTHADHSFLSDIREIDSEISYLKQADVKPIDCPECGPDTQPSDCTMCEGVEKVVEAVKLRATAIIQEQGWKVVGLAEGTAEEIGEKLVKNSSHGEVHYLNKPESDDISGLGHPTPVETLQVGEQPSKEAAEFPDSVSSYRTAIELSPPTHPEMGEFVEGTNTAKEAEITVENSSNNEPLWLFDHQETWRIPIAKYVYQVSPDAIPGKTGDSPLSTEIYQIADSAVLGTGGRKSYKRYLRGLTTKSNLSRFAGGSLLVAAGMAILSTSLAPRALFAGVIFLTVGVYSVEKGTTGIYYDGDVRDKQSYIHTIGYTLQEESSQSNPSS